MTLNDWVKKCHEIALMHAENGGQKNDARRTANHSRKT